MLVLALPLLLAALLLLVGCSDEPSTLQSDGVRLRLQTSGRLLALESLARTPLIETASALDDSAADGFAPVAARRGDPDVRLRLGHFGFRDRSDDPWHPASGRSRLHAARGDRVRRLELAFDGVGNGGKGAVTARVLGDGVFEVDLVAPVGANRAALSFVCHPDDQFVGLGAQTRIAHRGAIVPMWASEQGIGKQDGLDHYKAYTPAGETYDSYMPIPVLYNPRGYMLLVRGPQRTVFDLCKSNPERFRIESWSARLHIVVVTGDTVLQMIERMTAVTGRSKLPPRWVFAPWVDAIRGQANVLDIARRLRTNKVPASTIWTEDWAGGVEGLGGYHLKYQWRADTTLYPDMPKMTTELHQLGYRFLGYFNTFIPKDTPVWDEATKLGLLVAGDDGRPLLFPAPPSLADTALLDLTRPATRQWARQRMSAALALGIDGWMADFAEWLPWEARLSDGRSGRDAHNDYPRMWQRLNREVFEALRPNGDYTYFVRSGYTGTQALAPVVWAGDQNTDFGDDDGLPTVPRLGLNLGISGVAIFGHDIGGYTSIVTKPPDTELYQRWTQLGAFSPVMRTHHGSTGNGGAWFGKDQASLDAFAVYARAHMQLVPYLYALAQQAARRGWPMMRPMFVHYPEMPVTIADQYMLGDALLVAPVLARGVRARPVRLPAGVWYDYFSGKRYVGGDTVEIPAPLDRIPVLAHAGAVVPLLPASVQTLAPGSSGVTTHAAVEGALVVRMFLGADGSFTLADGGRFELKQGSVVTPTSRELVVRVGGERVNNACVGDAPTLPCVVHDAAKRVIEVRARGADIAVEADVGDTRLFGARANLATAAPVSFRVQY